MQLLRIKRELKPAAAFFNDREGRSSFISMAQRQQGACQATTARLHSLLLLKTVVILIKSTKARQSRAAGEARKSPGALIRCLKLGHLGEISTLHRARARQR